MFLFVVRPYYATDRAESLERALAEVYDRCAWSFEGFSWSAMFGGFVSMFPKTRKVVSPKEFDECFREEALIAKFSSPREEAAYERQDSLLIRLIRKEVRQHFGRNQQQPFVGDDWWPDHTRHIEATPAQCTAAFLTALRRLLKGDYKNYRIQICVYKDPMKGTTYIGSMALYSNRVLIEKRLHSLLESSAE